MEEGETEGVLVRDDEGVLEGVVEAEGVSDDVMEGCAPGERLCVAGAEPVAVLEAV